MCLLYGLLMMRLSCNSLGKHTMTNRIYSRHAFTEIKERTEMQLGVDRWVAEGVICLIMKEKNKNIMKYGTCHLHSLVTTCSKPVDNKFCQSTCSKSVDNV